MRKVNRGGWLFGWWWIAAVMLEAQTEVPNWLTGIDDLFWIGNVFLPVKRDVCARGPKHTLTMLNRFIMVIHLNQPPTS